MKKLLFVSLLCLFLSGCNDEPEGPQMGCSTGIRKTTGVRVLIRCCTEQEHLAGNNVDKGGISSFTLYTNQQWEKVSDCSKCQ